MTNYKVYIRQPGFQGFRNALRKFQSNTSEIVSESRRRRFFESPREEALRKAENCKRENRDLERKRLNHGSDFRDTNA